MSEFTEALKYAAENNLPLGEIITKEMYQKICINCNCKLVGYHRWSGSVIICDPMPVLNSVDIGKPRTYFEDEDFSSIIKEARNKQ